MLSYTRRNNDQNSPGFLISCEHPSRTRLVKNVDNVVTDSELRLLFEQQGDIETFNTTCNYDIRVATSAFTTVQNKPVENGKLQIHFLNPKKLGLKWVGLGAEMGAEMGTLGQIFENRYHLRFRYMSTTQCSSVTNKLSATTQQLSESHQILFLKPSANPLATPRPSANPSETLQPLAATHQQLLDKPSATLKAINN
ncbi:MEI2-like protein 1 [Tanacetum coccineum]